MGRRYPNQNPFDPELAREQLRKVIRVIVVALPLLIFFFFALSSFYTVGPDEEAVVIRFGRYTATTSPGLHFKMPFGVDQVIKLKTKRILQEEFGFRSAGQTDRRTQYSDEAFEEESLMLTGDLNVAEVEWVVQYQIADAYKYLFKSHDPTVNIRDVSESIMRRVVGDRQVTEVLTTGRAEIASQGQLLIQEVLNKYDIGVHVVSVKLQDVNPPDRVRPSFNEVNSAKQEQEKVINQAEEAYNKVIPEARGKAEMLISEAEGHAMAIVNKAKGDAGKFSSIVSEYRKSPEITRKRMYLETMEEIFGRLEKVIVVDPQVKGLLPIFQESGKTLKEQP